MAACNDQAEALSFADQVAVIRDSRLAQVGPPLELHAPGRQLPRIGAQVHIRVIG